MKEQHLTLQKNTKTLQAWSISVTAKLYIHLPGILMLNESKPTLKNSRRTLRQNFSSGTYSMVCFCFLSLRNLHSFDFTFFDLIPGEVRAMFEQADYANYMDSFFHDKPNVAISWIHDLGQGRYSSAADALLRDAEVANNLEGKHVCLESAVLGFHWLTVLVLRIS